MHNYGNYTTEDQGFITTGSKDIYLYQKELTRALFSIEGISNVQGLILRTNESGSSTYSLSCRILIDNAVNVEEVMEQVVTIVENKFFIEDNKIEIIYPENNKLKL